MNLLVRAGRRAKVPFEIDGLRVEVVDSPAGLNVLRPDYERLQQLTGNTLPFLLHDWHVAWWDHLAKASRSVRDELMIHVVRDHRGDCVAVVPLILTLRTFAGVTVGSLALLGPDANLTEIRAPLVAPGFEARAAWAVHARLACDRRWDWIHWSGITGPFGETLAVSGPLDWRPALPDHVLDLAPTWDAFRQGLKRNIRESLRHCYNSLKRDGLHFRTVVAETPDEVRHGLDTFLSLHAIRASASTGVPHFDRFATGASRAFLFDVCGRLARRGAVRVIVLEIDGRAVAARIAFVVSDGMYLYYSGFDPTWGKYSVMTTTVAEAIKYAIAQRLKTVSLSTGTDISKTRWGGRVVPVQQAIERNSSVRARLAYAAYRRAFQASHELHGGHESWMARWQDMLPRRPSEPGATR